MVRLIESLARELVIALVCSTLWFADSRAFAQGDYSPVSEDNVVALQLNHYFSADKKSHDSDFAWTFSKSEFVLKSGKGPIPADLCAKLLPNDVSADEIRGRWKLEQRDGQRLVLLEIKAGNKAFKNETNLAIYRTAPTVVRIGEPQYVFQVSDESRGKQKAAAEYGLSVGKKMPFHVADFVNGKQKEGCPSAMLANGKSRGIIVWARASAVSAMQIARALDEKAVDGEKLRGFVVAYGSARDDFLMHQETWSSLKHVIAGRGRAAAEDQFEKRGVDAKVQTLVFFLDGKDIRAMRSFSAEELTDAKIAEIAADAAKFAAREPFPME